MAKAISKERREEVLKQLEAGVPPLTVAGRMGCSVATVYNIQRSGKAEPNSRLRLDPVKVQAVRLARAQGESVRTTAAKVGVSTATVVRIEKGLAYTDVPLSDEEVKFRDAMDAASRALTNYLSGLTRKS